MTPPSPSTPAKASPAPLLSGAGPQLGDSLAQAARALEAGGLIAFATETVYGMGALASSELGLARLRAARQALAGVVVNGPSAWHAPSSRAVIDTAQPHSAATRRIIARLTPGPVTLVIEMETARLEAARSALSVPAGALDDGSALLARVPALAAARDLSGTVRGTLVAEGIPTGSGPARDAESARQAMARAGVEAAGVIDGGPSGSGKPSAVVRLTANGAFRVEREGAYDAAYIQRTVDRTILLVCTGNTCRSPMAAAIAGAMLGPQREGTVRTMVRSAGIGATSGEPVSAHAAAAVRSLGYAAPTGASRGLTREAIDQADAVYVMTRSHLRGVLDMAPGAEARVFLLDPRGQDIPDPIGGPPEQYHSVASQMQGMIQRRLKELDT